MSLDKVAFEEKPVNVLTRIDINKTLAIPSKINRLLKMKEFFAKSKSRSGKLVIPKNLLFTSDFVVSNFGDTQIHDYDDNKDIVGSRRDFTSFSYYINPCTGELQSDVDVPSAHRNDDFTIENHENLESLPTTPKDRFLSPVDWATRPSTPAIVEDEPLPVAPDKEWTNLSINIDEGIEMDEMDRANLLLTMPTVKLIDIRLKSPNLFPPNLHINEPIDVTEFNHSLLSVDQEITSIVKESDLPTAAELKIRNIFLIPLKKLKHKCLFSLPEDEYGELKRRKKDQHKSTVAELTNRQARLFKPLEFPADCTDVEPPFLGFTKEQQQEPMTSFNSSSRLQEVHDRTPQSDINRKYSNDSGFEADCSDENIGIEEQTTIPDINITTSDASNNSVEPETDNINVTSGDSCYHSLVSGDSTKTDLSSFFKDIESRNATIDESETVDESAHESEERVLLMQQSAMNVSWKIICKSSKFNFFYAFRLPNGKNI